MEKYIVVSFIFGLLIGIVLSYLFFIIFIRRSKDENAPNRRLQSVFYDQFLLKH